VTAGFTGNIRRSLYARLEPLVTDRCPFADLAQNSPWRWGEGLTAKRMLDCTWVRPKLVVQVSFVEWPLHGNLRHATFLGLRDDKRPRDVVREQ
jgi:bifunctional non-homologous end joining protein LigD